AREPAGVGLTFVESGPSEPRGTGRVSTNPTAPTLYQVTQVLGVGDSVHGQRPPRGVGWVNSRTRASQAVSLRRARSASIHAASCPIGTRSGLAASVITAAMAPAT